MSSKQQQQDTPREVIEKTPPEGSSSGGSGRGMSVGGVTIASSAVYSPNALSIQSSNSADLTLYSANGQGFTASVTAYVTEAMFRMVTQTTVSLAASFEVRIYAASGASPSLPTGSPLAVSAPVTWDEILALNNSGTLLVPFTFDGTFQVQQGFNYYVCVVATSGSLNATNYVWTYYSAVITQLNSVHFRNNAWTNNGNTNLFFFVTGMQSIGGGGSFDGGVINESLEINCKFPYLADQPAVNSWMSSAPLNPSNYNAYLRFTNVNNPQHSTDIYGITFKDDTNTDVPAIGVNDSLLVRKNLFAQGYIRTAKSILRLEKSAPYVAPDAGAVGNVNIGKANWPFDEIFASYGHIGLLTVPKAIYTDWIEGYTPNKPLTIGASSGGSIKLDGNVQITGTLTGGGGSGGTFDGGVINIPLEIKRTPFLYISGMPTGSNIPSLREWMYANRPSPSNPSGDWPTYINAPSPGMGLRFTEATDSFVDLFPFKFMGDEDAPGIAVNRHLIVRKDFAVRGFLKSYEGNIILHGNGPGAVYGNDTWNVGWGPRTGTPFIWLAEGGDSKGGAIGGNPAAETLLIVTNNTNPLNVPPEIPGTIGGLDEGAYKWGHLEAGNIMGHGFVGTNFLEAINGSDKITLKNHLVPVINHTQPNGTPNSNAVDLGELNFAYRNIFCRYGRFSEVFAPGGVSTQAIYSPTNNQLLFNYNQTGNQITLDGNVHVTGNLTSSSGGGASGILKGVNVQTNSSGVGTVTFPAGHFSSTPAITVTPVDSQGRNINLVITSQSASGFTVQAAIVGAHTHKIGEVNTTGSNDFLSSTESQSHGHFLNGSITTGAESQKHGHICYGTVTSSAGSSHSHSVSVGTPQNYWSTQNGNHRHQSVAGYTTNYTSYDADHQHQYLSFTVGSATGSESSHTHSVNLNNVPTQDNIQNHTHSYGFNNFPTGNNVQTHTHTTALSYRQLSLRTATGTQEFCGGVLYNGVSSLVQLFTESASDVPVQVYFNWTAI